MPTLHDAVARPPQPHLLPERRGDRSLHVAICAALSAALAAVVPVAARAGAGAAPSGETVVTCSNQTSGATWQIRIDYDRSTVDSNPASISDTEISWHDRTDGANYTLDRKTGKLTMVFASATGGNFLFHRCRLEN